MESHEVGKEEPAQENAADRELRRTLALAQGAVARWIRRQENALARLQAPEGLLDEAAKIEGLTHSLLAHRDRVRPGMTSVRLPDYASPELAEVEIALDPAQSFQEQVKARFGRAARLRRTAAAYEDRWLALDAELEKAKEWQARLVEMGPELAPQLREDGSFPWIPRKVRKEAERAFAELERRLVPRGLWPQPVRRRKEEAPSGPLRWDLEAGWTLWAGRSGMENDLLTGRFARSDDFWFHAAHVPGSHVILRAPGAKAMTAPSALMERAASVAAWLSKLRNQERAEVHWTLKKHVRKPRKAPPGTVVMEHFQVLAVRPQAPPREL